MGEGEEVTCELMDAFIEWKKEGGKRIDYLKKISAIEGVYVPSFYDVTYNPDGTIKERKPLYSPCYAQCLKKER